MKHLGLSAAAAGLLALMLSASPVLAGNGHGSKPGGQCVPGRPGCNVTCIPGRPGCERPQNYYRPPGHHHGSISVYSYYEPYPGPYYQGSPYYLAPPLGYAPRMSCNAAIYKLANRGFHRIQVRDCSGSRYNFIAIKNGMRFWISFNARNGRFVRQPI